jgi:hypothetical protein
MDRTVGEVIDLLDAEIAVVRGIQLAIFGEASLSHIEAFLLVELCEAHRARLERIRAIVTGYATKKAAGRAAASFPSHREGDHVGKGARSMGVEQRHHSTAPLEHGGLFSCALSRSAAQ